MVGDIDFVEGCEMKTKTKRYWRVVALVFSANLSACGIGGYWMTGDPSAGKNVKPYGAHWIKPGGSQEEWRRDWVGCGGLTGGGYADDAPPKSNNDVIFAADRKKRQELAGCMRQRGYQFVPGPDFREP